MHNQKSRRDAGLSMSVDNSFTFSLNNFFKFFRYFMALSIPILNLGKNLQMILRAGFVVSIAIARNFHLKFRIKWLGHSIFYNVDSE